ncbi:putative protein-serine/threonine kinase [Helianthus annuus]|nr:putative protein-serine/threonine kinase [Helianthus annuus]
MFNEAVYCKCNQPYYGKFLYTLSCFAECVTMPMQLLREISHENVVKLVNVHINHIDMSLYLAFSYAEHDLYVMGDGEEQGVVKIADFGLARIYQTPLKPLSDNWVIGKVSFYFLCNA